MSTQDTQNSQQLESNNKTTDQIDKKEHTGIDSQISTSKQEV